MSHHSKRGHSRGQLVQTVSAPFSRIRADKDEMRLFAHRGAEHDYWSRKGGLFFITTESKHRPRNVIRAMVIDGSVCAIDLLGVIKHAVFPKTCRG